MKFHCSARLVVWDLALHKAGVVDEEHQYISFYHYKTNKLFIENLFTLKIEFILNAYNFVINFCQHSQHELANHSRYNRSSMLYVIVMDIKYFKIISTISTISVLTLVQMKKSYFIIYLLYIYYVLYIIKKYSGDYNSIYCRQCNVWIIAIEVI